MRDSRYKKHGVKTADSLADCRRLRQVRQGGVRQQLKRETRKDLEEA
jgi:hypothetical protein